MNISFAKDKKITLIVTPTDLRGGFSALCAIALGTHGIDVTKGQDIVVFVSRARAGCKIITWDKRGSVLLTRKLHQGRFQRLLTRSGRKTEPLTMDEFLKYLDGIKIQEAQDTSF